MSETKVHPLEKLDFGLMGISVYKGVLVSKFIGGYYCLNTKCRTPQDVDDVIEKSKQKDALYKQELIG
jgi:hypothetical protein